MLFTTISCATAPQQPTEKSDEFTLGAVQRSIGVGMTGADVTTALGSPNIVTTDDQGNEVWVYDRVSTESASKSSDGFIFLLLAGTSSSSQQQSTSQKTVTVIIKFDSDGIVKDVAYHSAKF